MEYSVFWLPMKLCSNNPVVERAQPWLGTLVSMRVEGLEPAQANKAIDAAFEEIATVHRLMSFHEESSDVSRLNRSGALGAMPVHPYTFEVLQCAQKIAARSEGCFDISVGVELVEWQLLPSPSGAAIPPKGSWRDIEILSDSRVIFHRPLWIDLGGIAKGYAVDKATECLRACGAEHSVVNAGGDIRVQGRNLELIRLGFVPADKEQRPETVPVLELTDASVASSSGLLRQHRHSGRLCGPHVDGVSRSPAPVDRFVCVVAEQCVIADALTKVVMASGADSRELLRQCGATAHMYDPSDGWKHLAAEMEIG
jgi:FAD:protein FMN transferase